MSILKSSLALLWLLSTTASSIASPVSSIDEARTYEYFIDFGDHRYTKIAPPDAITCNLGKVFDKQTNQWRCASQQECLSESEISICGKEIKNILIRVNGILKWYGK